MAAQLKSQRVAKTTGEPERLHEIKFNLLNAISIRFCYDSFTAAMHTNINFTKMDECGLITINKYIKRFQYTEDKSDCDNYPHQTVLKC